MKGTLNFRYLRKNKTPSRMCCICHQESSKENLIGRSASWPYHLPQPHKERAIIITPILQRGKTEA